MEEPENNREAMTDAIDRYDAKGYTPIGYALQQGIKDLPSEGKRTIVLVSDGKDTCAPPPPCDVARDLKSQGVDLTVETVGFVADREAREQLQCIAKATGGQYRDAKNSRELANSLVKISTRAVRTADIEGQKITGGAAAADAPVLEPGTYQDTVVTDEALWYAVELEEGQELRARATIGGLPDLKDYRQSNAYLQMTMYTPLNEEILDPGFASNCCVGPTAITVANTTGTVDPDAIYAYKPGPYYVEVINDNRVDALPSREFPLELQLDVTGQTAQATTTQSTTPENTSSEQTTQQTQETTGQEAQKDGKGDQKPSKKPERVSNSQDSPNSLLLIIVIVALVALVAALAAVLFMRRG